MSKNTAVEWLHYHLLHLMQTKEWRSKDLHIEKFDELFVEAKAMEREQIIETWHNGYNNQSPMIDEENCGQQYYIETYKGGEQ
jgi:hypothetical protein